MKVCHHNTLQLQELQRLFFGLSPQSLYQDLTNLSSSTIIRIANKIAVKVRSTP